MQAVLRNRSNAEAWSFPLASASTNVYCENRTWCKQRPRKSVETSSGV
eukprot:CAMPEP_0177536116 /NCGR_PEP_ID=MMETSP0369-20130122/56981_1 /TAXON_ID=447022 ORGANISM="Scrippsiella hangoei-like, Strain SHHI-4" /NCGR_SAMPLE_ID=MMETSP0369 /ASSEMBLY_ACC=CAM_ASM_000364 /LENGTH=47 /DNA_ID= /DNA_START= /DNA_END= /DNA_ORIENTATION=